MPNAMKTTYEVHGAVEPDFVKAMNQAAIAMGGLQSQLKAFQKQAGMASLAANGIGKGFNKASHEAITLNSHMFRMMTAATAFGNIIGNVFVSGLQSAVGMAQQLGREFVDFAKSSVQAAAAHELMAKGMGNLLRNQPLADQIMAREAKVAIQSPFQAKILQDFVKRYIGAGATPEMATHLAERGGDIISALGGSEAQMDELTLAMSKIQASGRMTGKEALSFTALGIPWEAKLMKILGINDPKQLRKMDASGAITSKVVQEMIDRLTGPDGIFFHGMKNFSETFTGIATSIEDMVGQFKTHFGDILNDLARPIGTWIVDNDIWNKIFDWLDDARKMTAGVTTFIATLTPGDMNAAFKSFEQPFEQFNEWLHNLFYKVHEKDPKHPEKYLSEFHYELRQGAEAELTQAIDNMSTIVKQL